MSSRRNPFDQLEEMMNRMTRQFEEATRQWESGSRGSEAFGASKMGVDLADRGDEYVVTADFPGFQKDEIELRIRDGELSMQADRAEEREEEEETYLRSERERRSIRQTVTIPEPIDEENVTATLNNGVLTVHLPKIEPSEGGGRQIEIE